MASEERLNEGKSSELKREYRRRKSQPSGQTKIIEIITAIILLCGTGTGIWAAFEYHFQNKNIKTNNALVMDNQLLNMERETEGSRGT